MQKINDRMKTNYEIPNRRFLSKRTPVIIRIDGKAFGTYTENLKKPFDNDFVEQMIQTTKYLCENVQGCKFGYTQSDEISLLLTDYDTFNTQGWFNYCQNKMESISASFATSEFNKLRLLNFAKYTSFCVLTTEQIKNFTFGNFDSRAFNVPKDEVVNYFIGRQEDATKNSISMVAQSLYPHKELLHKNEKALQEMIFQKGINWNDFSLSTKRGTAVYKKELPKDLTGKVSIEQLEKSNKNKLWIGPNSDTYGIYVNQWFIDYETPIFSQNRELIEQFV